MTEAYLIKYAMTAGVIKGFLLQESSYAYLVSGKEKFFGKINVDIFLTRDEALKAAENLRAKKVASLEKQLNRYRVKKIKIVEPVKDSIATAKGM